MEKIDKSLSIHIRIVCHVGQFWNFLITKSLGILSDTLMKNQNKDKNENINHFGRRISRL